MSAERAAVAAVTAVCLSFGAGMLCFEGLLARLPLWRRCALLAVCAAATLTAGIVLAVTWTGGR